MITFRDAVIPILDWKWRINSRQQLQNRPAPVRPQSAQADFACVAAILIARRVLSGMYLVCYQRNSALQDFKNLTRISHENYHEKLMKIRVIRVIRGKKFSQPHESPKSQKKSAEICVICG